MGSDEDSHEHLSPEELRGWTIENSTEYKVDQMNTARRNWEEKLKSHNDIFKTLSEIDGILRASGKTLRFQISGHDYKEKTFAESQISELVVRICDSIQELRNIQNNFFQNISEDNQTRVENTSVIFEVDDAYDEGVEILTEEFSNIVLEIPTMASFFTTRIRDRMENSDDWRQILQEE